MWRATVSQSTLFSDTRVAELGEHGLCLQEVVLFSYYTIFRFHCAQLWLLRLRQRFFSTSNPFIESIIQAFRTLHPCIMAYLCKRLRLNVNEFLAC